MMYLLALTGILIIPTLLMWGIFRLITGSWGVGGGNTYDVNADNNNQAQLAELKKQSEALHQRNLYERGDSIYSHRHRDI